MQIGVIREGQFSDCKLNGWGRVIYSDCYEMGWFKNDKMHGHGVRVNKNGQISYSGIWKNGIKAYSQDIKTWNDQL